MLEEKHTGELVGLNRVTIVLLLVRLWVLQLIPAASELTETHFSSLETFSVWYN